MPPKYLEKIKNQSQPALNLRVVIQSIFPGLLENFVAQVGVKLVNANLSEIDPILQARTEELFDQQIGSPKEWKKANCFTLAHDSIKHVSGRIVFGENLVDRPDFKGPMGRYATRLVGFGMLARRLNFFPFNKIMIFITGLILEKDLAVVTRFVAEEVAKRQQLTDDSKKPFDCIQWAMEQDIPESEKTPRLIAERLAFATSGMINTPPGTMMTMFYDAAFHTDFVNEIREEMTQILAEDGNGWVESSIAKMKKLEAFVQESLRFSPSLGPLTCWRMVMCEKFKFDDDLTLPKDSIMTFPTYWMRNDPDTYDEPDKFDPMRFQRLRDASGGKEDLNSDHRFGYGRQGCPGRFYATRMMKLIIAVMIFRYDIRFAGGNPPAKPESYDIEPFFHPTWNVDLEFRVRQ
ncbi:cytochrome P450 [Aspergillus karnatakaensis]|uniref:cytochrome P450 n=1 Tax=Aspergillus karnatakaensis TaxID=1810916 RepID=UPI003CCCEFD5